MMYAEIMWKEKKGKERERRKSIWFLYVVVEPLVGAKYSLALLE